MEVVLSVFCAVAGLFCGLAFLWDYICLATGGTGTGKWLRVTVKLLLTLVLLHFHFELEMLD